VHP
jgi:hypothetical protein